MGCGLNDAPVNYPKSCPATDCCGTLGTSKVCGPRYNWTIGNTTPSPVSSLSVNSKLANFLTASQSVTVNVYTGTSFTCDAWEKSAKHLVASTVAVASAIYATLA